MDVEASSEMVASLLASTPLLSESWRLCTVANTTTATATTSYNFVSRQIGDVGYLAFSSALQIKPPPSSQNHEEYYSRCRNLVPLDSTGHRLFSPLTNNINHKYNNNNNNAHININGEGAADDGEAVVMVVAGFLNRFLSLYTSQTFQDQMLALTKKSKSIVITGHSIGATTASLCALWLLSRFQSSSTSTSILCITFGSPLLGNHSLSHAILRQRWAGNFCHVVSKYDIMPRFFLLSPCLQCPSQMHLLLKYWHSLITCHAMIGNDEKAQVLGFMSLCLQQAAAAAAAQVDHKTISAGGGKYYWPFGSYLFWSADDEGSLICLENAASVMKMMMHLTFVTATANPNFCVEDHLKYGDYVGMICSQFLNNNYERSNSASAALIAKEGLEMGRKPSLNCAYLAIKLSRVTPYRAEIEWFKASCDESEEQLGYYDSFKQRGSSKRGSQVNLNRHKLGVFWNGVVSMVERNELPHDFESGPKWVNASQFYMLLVEPLEIAEYYRSGMHLAKGHYLEHGRERRFEIFDRWWKERERTTRVHVHQEQKEMRSKFAGLTQDSCFWAKLEEARECLDNVTTQSHDAAKLALLWDKINHFERYAAFLVQTKEVSKDVVAKNSSYKKWEEDLRQLKSRPRLQSHHISTHQFPSLKA